MVDAVEGCPESQPVNQVGGVTRDGAAADAVGEPGTGRAWHAGVLLAESEGCLHLRADVQEQLCFPADDVHWDHLEPTGPGWRLAGDPDAGVVASTWPDETTDGPRYLVFDSRVVHVELKERWEGADPPEVAPTRLPSWGDVVDFVRLFDAQPSGDCTFTVPPFPSAAGGLIEGGHLLGQAVVAAAKAVPDQVVASAYGVFPRVASFADPVDLRVEQVHGGRSTSTVEVRSTQQGRLRAIATVLLRAPSDDVFSTVAAMPDVPGPLKSEPLDWQVTGREIRVVDGAYDVDPERIGPPVLFVWIRFRRSPPERYLRQALITQGTTHWTVAAAMRPHRGFSLGVGKLRADDALATEAQATSAQLAPAAPTLTTAPLATTVAFHDDADLRDWLLYANPAIYAGQGHCQGEGRVFTRDGRMVASYSVHAMARLFDQAG